MGDGRSWCLESLAVCLRRIAGWGEVFQSVSARCMDLPMSYLGENGLQANRRRESGRRLFGIGAWSKSATRRCAVHKNPPGWGRGWRRINQNQFKKVNASIGCGLHQRNMEFLMIINNVIAMYIKQNCVMLILFARNGLMLKIEDISSFSGV